MTPQSSQKDMIMVVVVDESSMPLNSRHLVLCFCHIHSLAFTLEQQPKRDLLTIPQKALLLLTVNLYLRNVISNCDTV